MSEDANIIPFVAKLSAPEAKGIIKRLVAESKISWSNHAKQRLAERDVTILQVLHCLERGEITEGPFWERDGYKTRVEGAAAGEWLRVVISLRIKQDLLIITVITDT